MANNEIYHLVARISAWSGLATSALCCFKQTRDVLRTLVAAPARWIVGFAMLPITQAEQTREITAIKGQVLPNGGTSLRDAVDRTEARVASVEMSVANVEASVAANRERNRKILDNAEAGYFETEISGRVIWTNRTFCKMLDWQPGDFAGMGWLSLVADESKDRVEREWSNCVKGLRDFRLVVPFVKPSGEIVRVDLRAWPYGSDSAAGGFWGEAHVLEIKGNRVMT